MKFSKRSQMLTSSPLYVFAKRVKEEEAKGREVISLGLGEPYNDTPEEIKEAGIEAIKANKTHYNPAMGSMNLRKVIAEKYKVEVERVAVSSGAKPFLGSIFWSLLDEGDIVFLAGPYYPPFVQIIESCGGKAVLIDTKPASFQFTVENVAEAIESIDENVGKMHLLINSPNNPTGVSYAKDELKKIVLLCQEKNVTIISDECYGNFSSNPYFTMREFDDQIIVVNSLSKSYAMTGWRVGFAICPVELNVVVGRFLENYIGCPSSISDWASIKAFQTKPITDFTEQRELIHAWLEKNEISFVPSTGGIFVFPDFESVMQRKKIGSSVDLATYFLEQAGVATTPGISFGEKYDTHLRMTYCIEIEKLQSALEKLDKVIN
jgi:aspartate aminotransferase